jgi:hypothetical protein
MPFCVIKAWRDLPGLLIKEHNHHKLADHYGEEQLASAERVKFGATVPSREAFCRAASAGRVRIVV